MRGLASCRAGVLRASVSQRSPRTNKHPQEGAAQELPLARLRGGRRCHVVPVSEPIRWQTHHPRGHGYSRKCNFISLPSSPLPPRVRLLPRSLLPQWALVSWVEGRRQVDKEAVRSRYPDREGAILKPKVALGPRMPGPLLQAPGGATSFCLMHLPSGRPGPLGRNRDLAPLPSALSLGALSGLSPDRQGCQRGWKHRQGSEAWGLCNLAQSRPFQN